MCSALQKQINMEKKKKEQDQEKLGQLDKVLF